MTVLPSAAKATLETVLACPAERLISLPSATSHWRTTVPTAAARRLLSAEKAAFWSVPAPAKRTTNWALPPCPLSRLSVWRALPVVVSHRTKSCSLSRPTSILPSGENAIAERMSSISRRSLPASRSNRRALGGLNPNPKDGFAVGSESHGFEGVSLDGRQFLAAGNFPALHDGNRLVLVPLHRLAWPRPCHPAKTPPGRPIRHRR